MGWAVGIFSVVATVVGVLRVAVEARDREGAEWIDES